MRQLTAIINVIAWAGFWAFGYLALTGAGYSETQLVTAALLAAAGLITGIMACLRLVRASGQSGYAKRSNRMTRETRDAAQARWEEAL
ncbi:hypothetical protein [Cribrihabitans pelagius]|uniref:hypothetical protein n=1 Tax=Cribrihabitans pelagius TaxID=1765746 RepID=UPI003B591857